MLSEDLNFGKKNILYISRVLLNGIQWDTLDIWQNVYSLEIFWISEEFLNHWNSKQVNWFHDDLNLRQKILQTSTARVPSSIITTLNKRTSRW